MYCVMCESDNLELGGDVIIKLFADNEAQDSMIISIWPLCAGCYKKIKEAPVFPSQAIKAVKCELMG